MQTGDSRETPKLGRLVLTWCPVIVGIAMIWILVGLAWFWLVYPLPALKLDTANEPVLEDFVVSRDQPLQIKHSFCSDHKLTAVVHREFRDGVIYTMPESSIVIPEGCHREVIQLSIPHSLPPGPYVYRETLSYQADPLRRLLLQLPEVRFTLVDRSKFHPLNNTIGTDLKE